MGSSKTVFWFVADDTNRIHAVNLIEGESFCEGSPMFVAILLLVLRRTRGLIGNRRWVLPG